jgi:hypothetical protein
MMMMMMYWMLKLSVPVAAAAAIFIDFLQSCYCLYVLCLLCIRVVYPPTSVPSIGTAGSKLPLRTYPQYSGTSEDFVCTYQTVRCKVLEDGGYHNPISYNCSHITTSDTQSCGLGIL